MRQRLIMYMLSRDATYGSAATNPEYKQPVQRPITWAVNAACNRAFNHVRLIDRLRTTGCPTVVVAEAAGEAACRPGSVHPPKRAGGHPSGTAIADSLLRSTREHRAGTPARAVAAAGATAP